MNSEIVSHWHPNLTISLVTDNTEWAMGMVPSPVNECKNYKRGLTFVFFHDDITRKITPPTLSVTHVLCFRY